MSTSSTVLSKRVDGPTAARLGKGLVWLFLGLTVAGSAGTMALWLAGCSPAQPIGNTDFLGRYGVYLILMVSGLAFSVLGTLIAIFRPHNRIGWLCNVTGMSGTLLTVFALNYATCGLTGELPLPGAIYVAWASYVAVPGLLLLLFVALPFLFPDGHFVSPRWRILGLALAGLTVALVLVAGLLPGPLRYNGVDTIYPIDNPLGLSFLPGSLGPVVGPAIPSTVVFAGLLANLSLVVRWRRATSQVRQQIKWLVFFLSTAVSFHLLYEIVGELFSESILNSDYYLFSLLVVFLGFPLVIGISVFKYRLYDIDLIIRRTLIYTVLSAVLALLYSGAVILLQRLLGGLAAGSQITIVISTLLIAALFSPLRRQVQTIIDRRFYRRKVDSSLVMLRFARAARDELNPDALSAVLLGSIEETMQPRHLSIWLRDR